MKVEHVGAGNRNTPVECRFERLSLTNWPGTSPLGIIEFTVFGKASGSLPAAQPIPVTN
jgi:hypothetical protein